MSNHRNIGRQGYEWEPHHVIFEEKMWTSNDEGKILRLTPQLIIDMYAAPHDELHSAVPFVPLLDYVQAHRVNREFYPRVDPLKNINELVRCINISIEHFGSDPKDSNLQKSLRVKNGLLAIEAIQAQIPYIRDGMVRTQSRPKPRREKEGPRRGRKVR